MADREVGPSCAGSAEAWASALDHRLANCRDRTMVHDWRELQQSKHMIVGDEHEGFEV